MEDIKEKLLKLIKEIDDMIENNMDKKYIKIKQKELDKLLDMYLIDI